MRTVKIWMRALRVYQWPKNLFVFAAVIFAQQILDPVHLLRSIVAFGAFCAASSAVYLFNDMMDVEQDRAHPEKRFRPLASGAISMQTAGLFAGLLVLLALGSSFWLNLAFLFIIMGYFTLTLCYTIWLKHIVLVDVLVLASGFVLRATGGAVAVQVPFSNWLVVCTFFLALILGFSKRRHEIAVFEEGQAGTHRKVLQHYTIPYLDHLIVIVTAATVITYTIYTCSPEVVSRLGTDKLYLTLPFVIYGLFRYFFLVHFSDQGGEPIQTLVRDWPLALTIVLYGLTCMLIIYGRSLAFPS